MDDNKTARTIGCLIFAIVIVVIVAALLGAFNQHVVEPFNQMGSH